MDFSTIFSNIDLVFAAVILIGGRYWGSKYFKISKNKDINFLLFATLFGLIWLFLQGLSEANLSSIFLTYLFTTSFYQLLGKLLFSAIERWTGFKDSPQVPGNDGPGSNPKDPPPPPPGN